MKDSASRAVAIAIVTATAILIAALGLWRLLTPAARHIEPDPGRYPVRGIDISSHNGSIDFDSVARQGFRFAYIKASEGVAHRDARFKANVEGARRAGMDAGAYHFFRFDSDGLSQARNFLAAVDSVNINLPLAIDVEEFVNASQVPTSLIRTNLMQMAAELRNNGYRVLIYTNKNGYNRFWDKDYNDAELWICSFSDPPIVADWRLWQHSHIGQAQGIAGEVDLDTFNGSEEDYYRWRDR